MYNKLSENHAKMREKGNVNITDVPKKVCIKHATT